MIICYSGTGNTAAVAAELASLTGHDVVTLRSDLLNAPDRRLDLSGKCIIWAFPTYSWGVPPVVVRFMNEVTIAGAETVSHHMVTTCGDDTGMLDRQWRSIMASRGWKAGSAFSVIMPNVYVALPGFDVDSAETERSKIDSMPAKVADIARRLDEASPTVSVHRGAFPRLKSAIYPWFCRHGVNPRRFVCHPDRCTSCGRCAAVCPMANIAMTRRAGTAPRPSWSDNCAMCLACYHACPARAVDYGRTTRSKGRYNRYLKK